MKKPLFTGVCTALVTPFLNEEVNYPMAEQLIRRQMEAGIGAVVLAGTTGESATLSDREKLELFSRCKQYAGNNCLIIAGTGSNSTKHAIELSKSAQACGADALLVVSPYYNKATADGIYAHYLAIAQAVDIPVIIYNVPSRTGVDIPIHIYERLSTIPNIAGVKEASGDITKTARILSRCGNNFPVWSGNDDQAVATLALGGSGLISVTSNICPKEMNIMCQAALSNDFTQAAKIQKEYLPLMDLMFCEVNPIPVKAAMREIGFDCGSCRLPLTPLSTANARKLHDFFS